MNKEDSLDAVVTSNVANTMEALRKAVNTDTGTTVFAVDEATLLGCGQSEMINLTLENTLTTPIVVFLGTPIGISEEAASVKKIWDAIPTAQKWSNPDTLAGLKDNQGAGAVLLQEYNRRFVRRPMLISEISVVTDSTSQRSQSIEKVFVPANIEASRTEPMEYKGVYTEFNQYPLLKQPMVLGEFTGISYILQPETKVSLNIRIHAVDKSIFKS